MTHFSFLVIGERERRLLHMVPGSPEASHPAPETTEAPKEARQLHINPDNPVDMQTQVLDASTRRGTQAVTAEFRRRDQVAASLQRQFDGMKTSGTFDAYPSRVQEWMAQTNASLNGRYTVGLMNGEVRLYPTGSVPTETRSEGLPPNPPMAPNRPSRAAPNTPESTPPATPEKGAPAPKAAADAPDAPNEPFDPVKGEGAPEGEKPAAGLDGEIPKKDQENLKKLAEKMLDGQDPTKMSEKQKDMLVGRVQMNTGVGVVEKGNKFEVVAPKTNMERLMNVIAGVVLFAQALFSKNDTKEQAAEEKNGPLKPSTTGAERKAKLENQIAEGKTAEQLAQDLATRIQELEKGDPKDPKTAQELVDLKAEANTLASMVHAPEMKPELLEGLTPENVQIAKEIFEGNFDHSGQLTELNVPLAEALVGKNLPAGTSGGQDVYLRGIAEIHDPRIATILAEAKGSLSLGVNTLSPEIARILAARPAKTQWIFLDNLETVTPETLAALATYEGLLSLDGLKGQGAEVVKMLMDTQADTLSFTLPEMDEATAKLLITKPKNLHIDQLSSLEPQVAAILKNHEGYLVMEDLQATDAVVAALKGHKGNIDFKNRVKLENGTVTQ